MDRAFSGLSNGKLFKSQKWGIILMKSFENLGFAPFFATHFLPFEDNDFFPVLENWVNE